MLFYKTQFKPVPCVIPISIIMHQQDIVTSGHNTQPSIKIPGHIKFQPNRGKNTM